MHGSKHVSLTTQRGVSLSGLIFVLAIIIVIAMMALKVIPSVLEFRSAKDAMENAKRAGGSVAELRTAFDKNAGINDVASVSGRDLIISKDKGQAELSFAYRKEIPLFANVFLCIDYAATTDPSGVIPEKPEATPN